MSLPLPLPPDALVRLLRQWSFQQRARRNAMVALTECTQRRVEREEVERFLADRAAARRTAAVSLQA